MLHLKALTFGVIIGVLTPIVPIPLLYESQVLAQIQEEQKAEADRLFKQGLQQLDTSLFQEALQSFQQALEIYREMGNSPEERLRQRNGEANSLNSLGIAYDSLGQYQKAIEFYQQALKIYREIGDSPEERLRQRNGEALSLGNLGNTYHRIGQYQKAIEFYQQALAIYRETGDSPEERLRQRNGEAKSLSDLGNAYFSLGQYQKALKFQQQALAIAREIGDRTGIAEVLDSLGNTYSGLGEYEKAIKFHQQALAIQRETGNRNGEANSLRNLGNAYWHIGEYDKATKLQRQALAIQQEEPQTKAPPDQKTASLNNLGNTYFSLGQYQKAIEFYQQALAIAREMSVFQEEAKSLGGLGNAYWGLGQYQKAIEFYQQSLAIYRKIGDRNGEAKSLGGLGNAYHSLEQYQQAIEFHQQALGITREIGDRNGEAKSLSGLGNAYYRLEQYQKAIEFHKKALAIQQKIGDQNGQAKSLSNLATANHSLEDDQKAIQFYQQSLSIFETIGDRNSQAIVLDNIGFMLAQQNKLELAIAFLKQSVNVTESIRKDIQGLSRELQLSYTETVESRYRRLADLLLKENRVLEAQRVLDLLKVQELEDYLKNVRANAKTASGIEFYQPEQDILSRYNELNQNAIEVGEELTQLQQKQNLTPAEEQRLSQLSNLQAEINADFNNFSRSPEVRELIKKLTFEAREQTLSLGALDGLRDKLEELDAVLFYPLILEDRLELVITTPNSPPLRRTVNVSRKELFRTIVRFRLALQDPTFDAVTPAQKLYRWLFEPLEDDLKTANAEVIIYAPDGVLRYIPLVALHDGQQWIAERFQVNNITAASLQEIDTQPQPQPKVLAGAFADESLVRPVRIGQRNVEFSGLPFAGIEVDGLKQTLPNTTAYVDQAFTLEAMKPKMNGYNILHFATHAAFVPGDPSESFIVFGDGENPTLRDVENWSLSNVDLVVLSACETGLGGFDNNGEQILGLGYQFQNRGARAVIASLWQVNDGGTQLLMNEFYNALQAGNRKTEALQKAQMALITGDFSTVGGKRSRSVPLGVSPDGRIVVVSEETGLPVHVSNNLDHPYYWASFILIGNGL